jgi:hypothetical protein
MMMTKSLFNLNFMLFLSFYRTTSFFSRLLGYDNVSTIVGLSVYVAPSLTCDFIQLFFFFLIITNVDVSVFVAS